MLSPFQVTQRRRNNRSLETWKDAKYVDTRTGETANAQVLNNGRRTRNKSLNTENLRPYRGEQMRSGIRSIRRRRYPIQPGDLVQANAQRYTAIGTHCKGAQVKLKNGKTSLSVASKSITLVKSGQGFSWQLSAHEAVGTENSSPL